MSQKLKALCNGPDWLRQVIAQRNEFLCESVYLTMATGQQKTSEQKMQKTSEQKMQKPSRKTFQQF